MSTLNWLLKAQKAKLKKLRASNIEVKKLIHSLSVSFDPIAMQTLRDQMESMLQDTHEYSAYQNVVRDILVCAPAQAAAKAAAKRENQQ